MAMEFRIVKHDWLTYKPQYRRYDVVNGQRKYPRDWQNNSDCMTYIGARYKIYKHKKQIKAMNRRRDPKVVYREGHDQLQDN